jgi:hypothetical protein
MVLLVLNKRPFEYLSGGLLLALPIGKKLVHINKFSQLFLDFGGWLFVWKSESIFYELEFHFFTHEWQKK